MSKKTIAYGEGYTAGKTDSGVSTNPYNEQEQNEQHSDWLMGYADGLTDSEDTDESEIEDEDDEDLVYEEEDEDDEDYEG